MRIAIPTSPEMLMRKQLAIAAAVILTLTACRTSTAPSGYLIDGGYSASVFTTTSGATVTNQLATGGSVNIVLGSDGSTVGRLTAAASGGEPAMDADLAGPWAQSGGIVTFHPSADTFLRDMPFTVHDGELIGDKTFGGVRVQLTLVRR